MLPGQKVQVQHRCVNNLLARVPGLVFSLSCQSGCSELSAPPSNAGAARFLEMLRASDDLGACQQSQRPEEAPLPIMRGALGRA